MTNGHNRHQPIDGSNAGERQRNTSRNVRNRMAITMILNDSPQTEGNTPGRHLPLPVSQHDQMQIRQRHFDLSRPLPSVVPSYQHSGYALAQRQQWQELSVSSPEASPPVPPNRNLGPRPPRHRYAMEEYYFIWYHRIDLAWPWDRIEEKFRRVFPISRNRGGLQCKLYRILEDHGIRISEQNRSTRRRGSDLEYTTRVNFMDFFDIRFGWMVLEHHYGPQ